MATLIKTVKTTPTSAQWGDLRLRFRRGDLQGALGAASLRARSTGYAWYVYATQAGYQVDPNQPGLGRFYKITVADGVITGELYEV